MHHHERSRLRVQDTGKLRIMRATGGSIMKTHQWRKSTLSAMNGNCVEVKRLGKNIGVRDSKNTGGPALTLTPQAWENFLRNAKRGNFDV